MLVTEDSGGTHTSGKLDAAARLQVPVVVRRPAPQARVPTVENAAAAVQWLGGVLASG